MTDNEIIKALECCTKGNTSDVCVDCPFRTTDICTEEENGVLKLALDLINRQKAESEKLEKGSLKEAMTFNSKTIARAVAEAIKEFAERLKKEFSQCQREYRAVLNSDGACAMIIAKKVTDKLLKEWVGENNG